MKLIYADYNSTTPSPPFHENEIAKIVSSNFGNASSSHRVGRKAKFILENSRKNVANLLGAQPKEIIFTSGATESNNSVIKGFIFHNYFSKSKTPKLLCGAGDHVSVLNTMAYCKDIGFAKFRKIPLTNEGVVNELELFQILQEGIDFISLIHVNSETGAIIDAENLSKKIRALYPKTHIHLDSVQATGKIDLSWVGSSNSVNSLALSGHKFGAVKGIGVTYIKQDTILSPIIQGGGQERGSRSGTENMLGIVSFGLRAKQIQENQTWLKSLTPRIVIFRNKLEKISGLKLHTNLEKSLPTTVNLSISNISSSEIILALDLSGISISSGSACSSGTSKPSHVLLAMGLDEEIAANSVRLSFGEYTTQEDLDSILLALYNLARAKNFLIKP